MRTLNEDREYKRKVPSALEKTILDRNKLQWVTSSFISAFGTDKDDLVVRFHNGSMYKYSNKGNLYKSAIGSSSKGRWLWRNILRPKVSFIKIDNLELQSDLDITDEQLMNDLDDTMLNNITKGLKDKTIIQIPFIDKLTGLKMLAITIAGYTIYKVLEEPEK